jgi:RHS repeat-associated protein
MGGDWLADQDISDTLTRIKDVAGIDIGWRYAVALDESVEDYDATGKLLSITDRTGRIQTVHYDTTGNLSSVSDDFGHSLTFTHDASNRIATMTDPAGGIYAYAYDSAGNLSTVTYPDGHGKAYHYEDPDLPHALTGITDENGQRYATYDYDAQGRAILSEHANGAGRVELAYNADGGTTVTDALGTARTHGFETVLGVVKAAGISQPGGAGCSAASSAVSHDANGNVASRDDFNGHRTRYWHDLARNLETTRVEGLTVANGIEQAGPETRATTTVWHPAHRLPAEERRYSGGADSAGTPTGSLLKTTVYTYDATGNLTARGETDNRRDETRAWSWTYTTLGRVLTADGPRTDVADITRYTYYPDDDPDPGRRGQLWTITNALDHVTEFLAYDLHGRATQIKDANGLVTRLAYTPRGWLQSGSVGDRLTLFAYDNAGQLTRLTLPDGSVHTYAYDAAHRLTDITDPRGNRLHYDLDRLGNRVGETLHDAQGNPVQSLARVFDVLGRLWKEVRQVNGQPAITEYGYDPQGNPGVRSDSLGHVTSYGHDALDRLFRIQDALGGQSEVTVNGLDEITRVTAPNDLVTEYDIDAFGQVRRETSPDTGTTTFAYDAAGNLKTRTDARGITTDYHYDALNRLVSAPGYSYSLLQYDEGANGRGRLTRMINSGGLSTDWSYGPYGEVIAKRQSQGGVILNLALAHDAGGRLSELTYPSGKRVTYGYSQGRISRITVNGQVLLDDVQYHPNGLPQSWTWGNGTLHGRGYDANGWPVSHPLGGLTRVLTHDGAGRITGYGHGGNPALDQSFDYDALDRLTGAVNNQGSRGYQYDANGNRTQLRSGANDYPYSYQGGSNRLQSVAGPTALNYGYDPAGNLTTLGGLSLIHDVRGRLSQVKSGQTVLAEYRYNGLGQRVSKVSQRLYAYDEAGRLIGEYAPNGGPSAIQETVYLGGIPVAVLKGPAIHYVHTDHLNAPRVITDSQDRVVWRWDNAEPFGLGQPDPNPSGLGVFTYNLRLPGQYYDPETGLHYNYFRHYDPGTGRYVEGDPIGLAGGLNLYAYVGGNPLNYIDPLGLAQICNVGLPISIGVPHTFLCANGQCGGKHGGGAGPQLYSPTSKIMNDLADKPNASCSDVPEKDCDPIAFDGCITQELKPKNLSEPYFFAGANCGTWAIETIQKCKNSCKKKKP